MTEPDAIREIRPSSATRVNPLELLLDLVFLFTVTQVTHLISAHPDWVGIGRAAVVLALAYLMYDGYIWLMNQLGDQIDRAGVRVALLAAMAAFLVLAAATPTAFDENRALFGGAFAVVVVIHAGLFALCGSPANRRAILRAGPVNFLAAVILVVAALLPQAVSAWAPVLALVVMILSVVFERGGGFDLSASHIAERHGLLVLIVFGEAIVGIGSGVDAAGAGPKPVVAAVMAVGIVGAMWWTYFSGSDLDDAVERIRGVRADERSAVTVRAFFVDHLAMMFGLVLFAAGITLAFEDLTASASPATAFLIGGGIGLYFLAQALYRRELRVPGVAARIGFGVFAPAAGVLGMTVSALVEVAVLLVWVAALVMLAAGASRRHGTGPDLAGAARP